MTTNIRIAAVLVGLCSVLALSACGGGGSNNNGSSTITAVTVSCSPTTLTPNQTSQCTASVTGTGNFNSAVTWAASVGSISSSGIFTAPGTNAAIMVTITATSTQDPSKFGSAILTVNPATGVNNVLPIVVDAGPSGLQTPYVNGAFATVTLCIPGTSTCQTIDHLLVDTGSSGVRVLDSALTLTLPQQKDASGNTIGECTQFVDGSSWGYVAEAGIQLAGEVATTVPGASFSGVPVQVIGLTVLPNEPTACSSGVTEENDLQSLGANGILGVGVFQQDCGSFCASMVDPSVPFYYSCPGGNCAQTTLALTNQVANPVWLFSQDNNGVLIQLPTVPPGTGAANPTGSLIFGIDSQTNNALGSASFYTTTADGSFSQVQFNGQNYNDNCSSSSKNANCSYLDSGSNGLFILDAGTLGVSNCSGTNTGFYCQNPTQNFTATNVGANSTSGQVSFSIGDATTLFDNNPNATAFVELGGPNPGGFDYGLPFYYGKSVFTVIENESTSKGTGPAWAY
jgi:hypothetical protein